jgi:hypothetical protein
MTTKSLPLLSASFGAYMLAMLSFILCAALLSATGDPDRHMFLPYMMPGFPHITGLGVVIGLTFSGLAGIYASGVCAAFFNVWTCAAELLTKRA